ncbi:3,4-dihydroxyphenylacetate 2,3-dioxygenase [Ferviditalea candida]|uniref:3,4-dihydroxyphenylacetate 2,3-dioxygenase n=1 Tax=Ferviditalea candida TaxID=3108399 RepID=A0ABU5ZDB6_9BACL|nr:3,4-dihydroxyphenylacetate 2,3-dioxygenase [Paenibacillaceae bacterium T2]
MSDINIIRLHHAALNVTDLEKARHFYEDGLGLIVTESDGRHLYLRGIDDANHHSLMLIKAGQPSLNHIAYRVSSEEALDRLGQIFLSENLPIRWLDKDEECGQGRALRVQDPQGFPVEFFCGMEKTELMMQKFHLHRGAKIKRIDHANCLVRDINQAYDWYIDKLGFMCSEYTVYSGEKDVLWAAWLHRKPTVHDLALIREVGPRYHHTGFWVDDAKTILDACDHLAGMGYYLNIERPPGRHGTSNAFFVYVRDPDGHRTELFTGDYFTNDPDWEPIRWSLEDPQRATFWGALPPKSWREEAMPVQHILTGELLKIEPPV